MLLAALVQSLDFCRYNSHTSVQPAIGPYVVVESEAGSLELVEAKNASQSSGATQAGSATATKGLAVDVDLDSEPEDNSHDDHRFEHAELNDVDLDSDASPRRQWQNSPSDEDNF